MGIADWLRGLSLERYAETFRDNAIDVAVLPELSESDLEKLGVLLGHRKIMLRAIAALRGGAAENIAELCRHRLRSHGGGRIRRRRDREHRRRRRARSRPRGGESDLPNSTNSPSLER